MSDHSLGLADVQAAAARIGPYIIRTPLLPSAELSALLGVRVSLKYELFQRTGSFKPRGALNKILSLSAAERAGGLLAVSGGNHGRAVAAVAEQLGLRATVLMPQSAAPSAIAAVRAAGAELQLYPSAAAAFAAARELEAAGLCFIHPFADPLVVAGQGTLGLEIAADAPDVTDVVASVGGGGMIGGLALALKSLRPQAHVWGAEPAGAAGLSAALASGTAAPLAEVRSRIATLSPPGASPLTLALAQRYVDEVLLFEDAEALADAYELLDILHLQLELAAACTLTVARRLGGRLAADAHLVLLLCGAGTTRAELAALAEAVGAP